jgi:threonine dehydratase
MNIDMIHAAAARLEGHVRVTPLLNAPLLDRIAGRKILVKAECLQWTGSFKYRGGWSAVSALKGAKGVIAFSSGNHAQGVALAASQHGLPAVIVMPSDAPSVKIANTRAYGAEVVLYDRTREDRDAIGAKIAAERGLVLVRPYDEPEVIAGQASVGLEILQQYQGDAEILVPCGGGGLTSGVALATEGRLKVRPCEPEGFDDAARSLASGQRERNAALAGSICDAIVTPCPGEITFPIMQRLCGPGIAVSDDEALRAMVLAFQHLRIVVEPGGAVALAAALFRQDLPDVVIAVASGGNVDPDVFQMAMERFG